MYVLLVGEVGQRCGVKVYIEKVVKVNRLSKEMVHACNSEKSKHDIVVCFGKYPKDKKTHSL